MASGIPDKGTVFLLSRAGNREPICHRSSMTKHGNQVGGMFPYPIVATDNAHELDVATENCPLVQAHMLALSRHLHIGTSAAGEVFRRDGLDVDENIGEVEEAYRSIYKQNERYVFSKLKALASASAEEVRNGTQQFVRVGALRMPGRVLVPLQGGCSTGTLTDSHRSRNRRHRAPLGDARSRSSGRISACRGRPPPSSPTRTRALRYDQSTVPAGHFSSEDQGRPVGFQGEPTRCGYCVDGWAPRRDEQDEL